MLNLQKYDFNTWTSGAYNKYYNSVFSCNSFSQIEFSTPISGTLNVTITNNTLNNISNMYDVPPEYNLQLDAIDSNNNSTRINVDLGTTTLYPNDSVTIPITFPNDTKQLLAYVGGTFSLDFPQISIPYTGWAKVPSEDLIHERNNNDWT